MLCDCKNSITALCVFLSACSSLGFKNTEKELAKSYVRKLFAAYGDGEKMNFESMEHFLEHLGLGNIIIKGHGISHHLSNTGFKHLHGNNHSHHVWDVNQTRIEIMIGDHGTGNATLKSTKAASNDGDGKDTKVTHITNNAQIDRLNGERQTDCLSPKQLLATYNRSTTSTINVREFLYLCPAILSQIDSGACRQPHYVFPKIQEGNVSQHTENKLTTPRVLVWGFGMLAVFIISAVGLAGVAVVPIIQKKFYKEFLQFLVAMAIGALTGDAMLHLLPHALSSHGPSDKQEESGNADNPGHDRTAVWKGLVGLAGIFVFFIAERMLNIIATVRNNKKQKNKRQTALENLDNDKHGDETLEKLQNATDEDDKHISRVSLSEKSEEIFNIDLKTSSKTDDHTAHKHGHSHGHGTPSSASSVASMVIMGDGLHNFSDGLAIGAAFASGMSVGISTTLAVFCHELPHELGDFAMLLKTGMRVRLAIFYNLISSVLCFIGAAIGIAIGENKSASEWILLAIAGTFLYIALVDMLPEMAIPLNSPVNKHISSLILQLCGILLGSGLMLTIAVYEDQIKIE